MHFRLHFMPKRQHRGTDDISELLDIAYGLHIMTAMSSLQTLNSSALQHCRPQHFGRRPLRAAQFGSCQRWACVLQTQRCQQRTNLQCHAVAAVVAERAKAVERIPTLPFVKIAGQEDMKLAILLNVIDPKIGGVLIMGERGTGKSVAVSLPAPSILFPGS